MSFSERIYSYAKIQVLRHFLSAVSVNCVEKIFIKNLCYIVFWSVLINRLIFEMYVLLMDCICYLFLLYRCYYIIILTETILQHNVRLKVFKYKVITAKLLLCIFTYLHNF